MAGSRLIVSLIGAVLALWGLVIHGQADTAAVPADGTTRQQASPLLALEVTDDTDPTEAAADAELTQQGRTLGIGMAAGGVLIAAVPWVGRRRTG
ncbi:hypothetical protein [Streptomyces sclerotialus]|uniref:hypothetical protein n=1 Tax=Streptomyces sclerotialus TaxID=1957 RepID=UPI0004CB8850